MKMKNELSIIEYERIYCEKSAITKEQFENIERFILENSDKNGNHLLELGADAKGKYFKAQNYVGVIQLNGKFTIEILPKIHKNNISKEETRKILLEMLKETVDINYKNSGIADLSSRKGNLLEIFISMFIDETEKLLKRGMHCNYVEHSGNENYFKGKLNIQQNIRNNLVHKERFYVTYDLFSVDRSENRLIKSTLKKLKSLSIQPNNQRRIMRALLIMDEVPLSVNYEADFSKCVDNINMTDYRSLISWAQLFLRSKTFTTYKGNHVAYALLFPMEKIFENYIAKQVNKVFTDYKVTTQKTGTYLFDNKFMLKPDIVLEKNNSVECIIDTKWKLLNGDSSMNYGISQSDMYQMYAYAKKYECKNIVLCYPASEATEIPSFHDKKDGIRVYIKTINLCTITRNNKNEIRDAIKQLLAVL